MSYLKQHGLKLIDNGYDIIPIKEREKKPALNAWQNIDATQEMLEGWLSNGLANCGAGVLTKFTPAVDIDVHDEEIVAEMVSFVHDLLGPALLRTGLPPKTLIPCRTDTPFRKMSSRRYVVDGKSNQIEILCDGQQFVAFAIHPQTNKTYIWDDSDSFLDRQAGLSYEETESGKSIVNVKRADLPLLTQEKAQKIIDRFHELADEKWSENKAGQISLNLAENGYTAAKRHSDEWISKPAEEGDAFGNFKKPFEWSFEKIRETVFCLDPDMLHPEWVKVGMGLYHQFDVGNTEEEKKASLNKGFNLWFDWCSKGQKFDEQWLANKTIEEKRKILRSNWNGFKANLKKVNPVTFATINDMAKKRRSELSAQILNKPGAPQEELNSMGRRIIPIRNLRETAGGEIVPLNWLVEGFIEENSLCMFFGPPGCGKSFVAVDVGLHIGMGRYWHGLKVKQAENVLFVASEGAWGMRQRQQAWLKHYGIELDDFESDPKYDSIEETVDIYSKDGAIDLVESIDFHVEKTGRIPKIIMIDTLARSFGEGDENSTRDMNVFVNHIKTYLMDRYGCTILIIHHSGHQNKERARGSISLKGALSSEYWFDPLPKEGDQARLKLSCTKMRDAEPMENMFFMLKKIKLGDPADDFRDDSEDNPKKNVVSLVPEKMNTPPKDDSSQPVIEEVPVKGKQKKVCDLLRSASDEGGRISRIAAKKVCIQQEVVKDGNDLRITLNKLKAKKLIELTDDEVIVTDEF